MRLPDRRGGGPRRVGVGADRRHGGGYPPAAIAIAARLRYHEYDDLASETAGLRLEVAAAARAADDHRRENADLKQQIAAAARAADDHRREKAHLTQQIAAANADAHASKAMAAAIAKKIARPTTQHIE